MLRFPNHTPCSHSLSNCYTSYRHHKVRMHSPRNQHLIHFRLTHHHCIVLRCILQVVGHKNHYYSHHLNCSVERVYTVDRRHLHSQYRFHLRCVPHRHRRTACMCSSRCCIRICNHASCCMFYHQYMEHTTHLRNRHQFRYHLTCRPNKTQVRICSGLDRNAHWHNLKDSHKINHLHKGHMIPHHNQHRFHCHSKYRPHTSHQHTYQHRCHISHFHNRYLRCNFVCLRMGHRTHHHSQHRSRRYPVYHFHMKSDSMCFVQSHRTTCLQYSHRFQGNALRLNKADKGVRHNPCQFHSP
mmetsp:Transcript_27001/g.43468  ORF Transcript_27001/g.43468 Transcript_27001/m.43468 type:complete len:297 (-) Transcript_27001:2918-3808(-)